MSRSCLVLCCMSMIGGPPVHHVYYYFDEIRSPIALAMEVANFPLTARLLATNQN